MSINFNEKYQKIPYIKKINKEINSAFNDVKQVLTLIWKHIDKFIITKKFNTTSLITKNNQHIIKTRIKKPGHWTSEWYRAIFHYKSQHKTSSLLLIYSKNHLSDNENETQRIQEKIKEQHKDIYKFFREKK